MIAERVPIKHIPIPHLIHSLVVSPAIPSGTISNLRYQWKMRTKSRYAIIQTEFIRHVAALLILWSRNCRNKFDFHNWIVVFLVFPQKVSTICSENLFWRNRHPSPTWLLLDVDRDPKTWRPIKLTLVNVESHLETNECRPGPPRRLADQHPAWNYLGQIQLQGALYLLCCLCHPNCKL